MLEIEQAKGRMRHICIAKSFHQRQPLSLLTRKRFEDSFIKYVCLGIVTKHQVQFLNKKANDYRIPWSEYS